MARTQAQAFRPSLLIGVGGAGASIAQNVYARALRAGIVAKGRIRVLTFDTDDNDTRRLGDLDQRQKIRFSEARTIDDLLDRYPEVERDWFVVPRSSLPMELRKMTLLDGAGQVRMLTRLALHDACRRGMIEDRIGAAISELGRHDNREGFDGQVNTMMVGSLAGATGSGSFLQIAALINDIAVKRNVETSIFGLFIMPDVFVRSGVLPLGQIPNILANGYAALKEFHAATIKATDRQGRFDFDFEFAPGKHLGAGDIPFDSLTLIDFEDMSGGNLGRSIPAYRRLAERAAFTLLFTPVGGKVDSVTVNDVRSSLSAAGRSTHNRIAGIGLCALVYPHADIVDYLSRQLATEVLEGDWMRLDRQFDARLRRFREQRNAGNMTVTEPQQAMAYLDDLKQLAITDQVSFFREIYDKLNPEVRTDADAAPVVMPLHETYLDAFERHVKTVFWGGEEEADILRRPSADPSQFAGKASLIEEVRRRENRLDNDLRLLDQSLVNRPNDIVVNLFSMADDLGEADWRDHHLQSYIIHGGPHLVQSRAFLFAARLAVEKRLAALSSDDIRKRLFKLANVFDSERGASPDRRGTPVTLQLANAIAARGVLGRLVRGGSGKFVESYVGYYNASLRTLRQFADDSLMEKAYRLLLAEIDEVIGLGNGLFKEIDGMIGVIRATTEDGAVMHERAGIQENVLYVCASRRDKLGMWEEVQSAIAGQRLGADVNQVLAGHLYAAARRNRVNREDGGLQELRNLFREAVVDGFARQKIVEDYASVHDLSLVGAVRKQVGFAEKSERRKGEIDEKTAFADELRRYVGLAERQSEVLLTLTTPSDGQAIRFWAFHPSLREEMSVFADVDQLINPSGQGNQPLEEPEFSKAEMISVTLRVNLELAHLAKLSPPYRADGSAAPERAGRYYDEYQAMVDELIDAAAGNRPARTITPHVHRDWHKPGLLPEISEAETRRHVVNINRAFAAGLAFGLLRLIVNHDHRVAEVRTVGQVAKGGVSVVVAASHDLYGVLEGFERHPEAVRGCLGFLDELFARLEQVVDRSPLEQAANAENLARILSMAEMRTDENRRDSRVAEVVAGYARLIHDLVSASEPTLPARIQFDRAEEMLGRAGEAAVKLVASYGTSRENLDVMQTVFARGLENWREATGFLK